MKAGEPRPNTAFTLRGC